METSSAINPLDEEVINDKLNNHEPPLTEEPLNVENSESSSGEMQGSNNSYLTNTIIRILPILAMFGLLITVLVSSRKLQIALRKKKFSQKDGNKAAIEVYDYIVNLHAYAKPNRTADSKIPKDLYNLVLKARFSQHTLTEQELGILLAYAENQALEIQKTVSLLKQFIGKYIYVIF